MYNYIIPSNNCIQPKGIDGEGPAAEFSESLRSVQADSKAAPWPVTPEPERRKRKQVEPPVKPRKSQSACQSAERRPSSGAQQGWYRDVFTSSPDFIRGRFLFNCE